MNREKLAIGVFDSGMGGLTVLRALRALLPQENFVYLGDTARLPYGTKSADTVKQYATQMTKVLVEHQIKALVIACNTATTAALTHLQELYTDIPVIGVVKPGAKSAARITENKKVLVLATETTIASKAYHQAIQAYLPDVEVSGKACSLLVALAEEGVVEHELTRATLQHYLKDLSDQDTILLGCTHFPVFHNDLHQLFPNVHIVDSATATAEMLEDALKDNKNPQEKGKTTYLVTDAIERFCRVGKIFLGETIEPHQVTLIDA
ncbi:MAG: glutamate racemase [Gammaproteobacteria bacterium]|nr:glutamate racemase [Gammaproteobacteria bacterium]